MIRYDIDLKEYNTFGISAKTRFFAEYSTADDVKLILDEARAEYTGSADAGVCNDLKVLFVGQGSNLLFMDDYPGLVLHSNCKEVSLIGQDEKSVRVRVGAGMVWDDLVAESLRRKWYGLENLTAIPGEVGAASVQNIGAYGVEVKDFVVSVNVVDIQTREVCSFSRDEMQYGYRYSRLKSKELWGRYAVISVDFVLSKTFVAKLEYGALASKVAAAVAEKGMELDADMLRDIIRATRDEKLPDPKVLGNAGSFFMNPVVERCVYELLAKQYADMPHYDVDENHVKIPAGWLIDRAGWKGKSIGPAGVYERQALVLVNLGGAKGNDIVHLCRVIQADVKEKFGISIHPEVNFI
ncbi:MAG: UDP-N-acetylmuramate dehydrogenase [Bacteroidales bacterium]|nr:UDP-N-acetylmuramate dehydrogenase [Bacteroidales bacterium]